MERNISIRTEAVVSLETLMHVALQTPDPEYASHLLSGGDKREYSEKYPTRYGKPDKDGKVTTYNFVSYNPWTSEIKHTDSPSGYIRTMSMNQWVNLSTVSPHSVVEEILGETADSTTAL